MNAEPVPDEPHRAGRPVGGGNGSLNKTEPFVRLICWSGPLSALTARLRLTDSELCRLRNITRNQGKQWTVEVNVAHTAPIFAALRRRLAGGEGE